MNVLDYWYYIANEKRYKGQIIHKWINRGKKFGLTWPILSYNSLSLQYSLLATTKG